MLEVKGNKTKKKNWQKTLSLKKNDHKNFLKLEKRNMNNWLETIRTELTIACS